MFHSRMAGCPQVAHLEALSPTDSLSPQTKPSVDEELRIREVGRVEQVREPVCS